MCAPASRDLRPDDDRELPLSRRRTGFRDGRRYHRAVDEKLDRIFEDARRTLSAAGPVTLDPRYLRAIERLEARPEAASGADRTWVVETARRAKQLLSRLERLT